MFFSSSPELIIIMARHPQYAVTLGALEIVDLLFRLGFICECITGGLRPLI